LRKKQDEVQATRTKLAAVSKKEGNNFLTKDFTDEIYNREINANLFVSTKESTMLSDLLVVLAGNKIEEFRNAIPNLMNDYY